MPLPIDTNELSDDALTDRVRVFQRKNGHRYSIDDVATAWLALRVASEARSLLDLGCGIGSVLLMLADRLPVVRAVGVEAQPSSYALAERNVIRNRLGKRVTVQFGDLRDRALLDRIRHTEFAFGGQATFDLVTGTPPYLAKGTASVSPDPQRAHARIELRGGVEAYLEAAAHVLAPQGRFVMCAHAVQAARVEQSAFATGLQIVSRVDVIPMLDRKKRLFSVYCFQRAADGGAPVAPSIERLVLRDAQGARTAAAHELRSCFGLSIDPSEPASPPLRTRVGQSNGLPGELA
jgi:tRNA1Val (adenine37-N6)-methyltransferase